MRRIFDNRVDHTALPEALPRDAAHQRAPYAEALQRHARRIEVRAAVPGHVADPERGVHSLLGHALALDIPPLTDGIDADPHAGVTPLDEARALAADAWGARTTWFLTNGASQGNLTVCLALRSRCAGVDTGHVVTVRSMHSSVTDGMALAGLSPHSVMPHVDAVRGIAHSITPDELDDALRRAPDAIAAWVVSPTYFGAVADIAGLARVAHEHGLPLIVDEAWGAHFGFHPSLPVNALRLGADLVVSSTHKLGGSLGQSAMLHLGHGPWADELAAGIERALRTTSSTSESSLLIAGLDLARRDLVTRQDAIGDSIDTLDRVRAILRHDSRYTIPTDELLDPVLGEPSIVAVDPMRLVVDTRGTGLSGHEVRHRLFHEHGIQVEMSTDAVIVALIGAGSRFNVEALLAGFDAMPHGEQHPPSIHELPAPGPRSMDLRQASMAATEIVDAVDAVGRISSDSLAAYPPGVPNILPGEVITDAVVDFLQASAQAPHGYVRGALDQGVTRLRVVR